MREPRGDGGGCRVMRWTPIFALPLLAACLPHPPPAEAPYRAVGKAPADWTLVIDDRHVTWLAPGQNPIMEPVPKPIIGIAGEIYQTPRIDVNIVHGGCSDGKSSRQWPDSVQVTVDSKMHEGCGGL